MLGELFILVVSLVALLLAADKFVESVVEVARGFNVSTMVIGLTVVAIGTSLPELSSSVAAAIHGHPEIALGNVIGSNICNVGLILGLPALFVAIQCKDRVLRREGAIMLAATLVMWVVLETFRTIPFIVGLLFVMGFIAFVVWLLRTAESVEGGEAEDALGHANVGEVAGKALLEGSEETKDKSRLSGPLVWLVVSLGLILASSEFLVRSAIALATLLEVSENVIAISLIALGTSLPELSVSFAAARKNEGDILVGNIIGSNLSNILLVIGTAAMISPLTVADVSLGLDIPAMTVFSLLMILFLFQSQGINRSKGIVLLLLYALVIARIVLIPV